MRAKPRTPLHRALRYIRGEGYTVRELGDGNWLVRQRSSVRRMSRAELLAFAGISEASA